METNSQFALYVLSLVSCFYQNFVNVKDRENSYINCVVFQRYLKSLYDEK